MSLIDALLLGTILITSAWWIFGRLLLRRMSGVARKVAPLIMVALAALQLAIEGFYWQFLPSYLLILTTTLLAIYGHFSGWFARLSLAVGILAAVAPWMFVPVPRMTQPAGRYPVGTEIFRWTDISRAEEATKDPTDKRGVIVQAWYPAVFGAGGAHSTYIDGLHNLPAYVTLFPRFMLRRFDRVDTNGVLGAAISRERPKWPVVVFSPGYGAPRAFYTSLVTALASRGFVILAMDHPYEAAVTELPDGGIATTVEHFSNDDPDRTAFMRERLEVRAADVSFVLDQLSRTGFPSPSLSDRLDLEHTGVIGHSFGGATAAVAMHRDSRIKAAANLDGTLYGDISARRLAHPFLLLESDHAETGHSERYLSGNRSLLANLTATGYRYEIRHANHYSFTDAPLFLSAPARWALALFIGGARGPTETHRITSDILAAFLQGPLTEVSADIQAVAKRYEDIVGGAVK